MASPTGRQLVFVALTQRGDPYVWGAAANIADPNPPSFDCEGLVKWSAGRLGVGVPAGSWIQATWCRNHGLLIPVAQAIKTPGALLFAFSSSPFTGSRPSEAHVAISQGNGYTIEARGVKYGTNVFPANGRGWTMAGLLPGFDYLTPPPVPAITAPPPPPAAPAPGGPTVLESVHAAIQIWGAYVAQHPLHLGDKDDGVRIVRARLQVWGFTLPSGDVFDQQVEVYVRFFQALRGLTQDGIVGPVTYLHLLADPHGG